MGPSPLWNTQNILDCGSWCEFVTLTFSLQMICLLTSVMFPFRSRRQSLVVQQSQSLSSENWTGRRSELLPQYHMSKFKYFLNHLFTCYCLQFTSVVLVEYVATDWVIFHLYQAACGNGVLNRLWILSLILRLAVRNGYYCHPQNTVVAVSTDFFWVRENICWNW